MRHKSDMDRTPMVDRNEFEGQVQEALTHLYDLSFLQHSPLLRVFDPGRSGITSGKMLHQELLAAIEQLKPPADVSPEAVAWRLYRSLILRYVRSLSAGAAARELGLSTRQAQRIHSIAVASIAAALWEGWAAGRATQDSRREPTINPPLGPDVAEPAGDEVDPDDARALEEELDAILAGDRGEPQPFSSTLRSAIETIGPILRLRQIRADISIDPALTHSVAPHDLTRQALVQLLLGALTLAGPGILRIVATAHGESVSLVVTASTTAAITTPHEAASSASATRLPDRRTRIAERLLSALGGTVTITAEPALRIVVELPLEASPTVLMIEDNPQVMQLFQRYLAGTPYQLIHVGDADQALEAVHREHPSIITLDVMMPRRDGWELLQALRVDPRTQDIPVLICSVLRDQELAFALGATDFLPKPVTQHALLSALHRHRSAGRVRASPAS